MPAFESLPERRFILCSSASWNTLSESLQSSSRYFALLIMADSEHMSDETIRQTAGVLLSKGLATLCAWGPDCKRVHDLFDAVDVERELDGKEAWGPDDVVMTTWHDEDSLPEVLWYFAFCAYPTDYFLYECKDWIIAVIGNAEWEKTVREQLVKIIEKPQEC